MGSISKSTFKLELAKYEDIDTLFDVYFQAFAADPIYPFLYPNVSWEEKVRFEASGPKRVFKAQPWAKLYKITEESTGKMVAWTRWHYPRALSDEERKMEGDPDLFDQVIPEGSNIELCEDLFAKLEWAEHTFVDREFGLFLNYLIVHPDYQGLGLGKQLMNIGLEEADRIGAKCFVVSTPAGEGVYKKAGFEEIDRFVVDPRPFGAKSESPWFCMRREPKAKLEANGVLNGFGSLRGR